MAKLQGKKMYDVTTAFALRSGDRSRFRTEAINTHGSEQHLTNLANYLQGCFISCSHYMLGQRESKSASSCAHFHTLQRRVPSTERRKHLLGSPRPLSTQLTTFIPPPPHKQVVSFKSHSFTQQRGEVGELLDTKNPC
ncbi:hypothetical protein QQF64_033007 [Cirrhinus molitorella]|uniref:Uncharacterized protein n=1 Tax=Cirrhinus molitorella TaxID=172907 RepID=A0ABR3MSP9_9TELE